MAQLSTPLSFARHSREGGNPDSSILKSINELLDTRLRGYDELGCYKYSMKVQQG